MGSTTNVGGSNTTMSSSGVAFSSQPVSTSSIPSSTATNFAGYAGAASIMQGLGSFGSAFSQAQAQASQAAYQKQQYEFNQKLSQIQADDTVFQGNVAANNEMKAATGVVGTQRADFAASGVDVNSGTASIVQDNTATMGMLSAINIRNNAFRQALGFKMQAVSQGTSAGFAAIAGTNNTNQTLLTGGLNAVAGGIQSGYYFGGGSGNISRSSGNGSNAWYGGAS